MRAAPESPAHPASEDRCPDRIPGSGRGRGRGKPLPLPHLHRDPPPGPRTSNPGRYGNPENKRGSATPLQFPGATGLGHRVGRSRGLARNEGDGRAPCLPAPLGYRTASEESACRPRPPALHGLRLPAFPLAGGRRRSRAARPGQNMKAVHLGEGWTGARARRSCTRTSPGNSCLWTWGSVPDRPRAPPGPPPTPTTSPGLSTRRNHS